MSVTLLSSTQRYPETVRRSVHVGVSTGVVPSQGAVAVEKSDSGCSSKVSEPELLARFERRSSPASAHQQQRKRAAHPLRHDSRSVVDLASMRSNRLPACVPGALAVDRPGYSKLHLRRRRSTGFRGLPGEYGGPYEARMRRYGPRPDRGAETTLLRCVAVMPSRTIPQRDLRNNIAVILREAEAGTVFTVTVRGRPVAQLGPPAAPGGPRTDVDRETILGISEQPIDVHALAADLDTAEAPLGDPWLGA